MQVHHDADLPLGLGGSAVTIGAYDGVHTGHRTILGAIARRAEQSALSTVVVTFDPHPAQVVRPDSAPRLLTDLDQRLELLAAAGVEHTLVIHFDQRRASEEAEEFVREVLVDGLSARLVIVGEDFHFGHRRQGNVDLLRDMGLTSGFEVLGHHLVGPDGREARDEANVSSTAIRRALLEGRLHDANVMLGRPHEMRGPVVSGDRRGREIGFPTANVAIGEEILMPADGIYAGWLTPLDDPAGASPSLLASLPAAIYVGKRPTFYDDEAVTLLEVHCLDWSGDLYGRRVGVRFEHRVRGDRRFDSVAELAAQLERDCRDSRRLLEAR